MIEGKHRIPDHTEFAGNDKIGVFLGFLRGHHIWLEFISVIRSKKTDPILFEETSLYPEPNQLRISFSTFL